ncbi:hypothetical protein [Brevibacillus sp. HD3.3A]|uniref:hypothetical protein n=1 Tax=Brevibacillus sp. HD3.3A TaxID=2738979 RepID=UPI00156B3D4C|nr:hypothetical protein [Brevibacillus sp. HD3.3A]UED72100.1 hypothetical protein HP435_28760 [Brevibacillus sp. HD3.3A]
MSTSTGNATYFRTVKRENPFVQLDRYFIENDDNLKWASKGLLSYLLSRPDDWQINKADLLNRASDGKEALENSILDLMLHGYLYYFPERKEDGTIERWVYLVFERPEFNPHLQEAQEKAMDLINKKKNRNKKKNDKRLKGPETDNPILDEKPETDNPEMDLETDNPEVDIPEEGNPVLDNPPYTNNKSNDIDLSDIEEDRKKKEHVRTMSPNRERAIELFKVNSPANGIPDKFIHDIVHRMTKAEFEFDSETLRQACIVTFPKLDDPGIFSYPHYFMTVLEEKAMRQQYTENQKAARRMV